MSKYITLDRIDFEKLKEKAKVERAEFLRQHGAIANMVVGSKLRANYVATVIAILLISFGVKMFFLSAPTAEADIHSVPSASMNVLQMQIDHPDTNSLAEERVNDMSLVFSAP
jgi:hypothetical protein